MEMTLQYIKKKSNQKTEDKICEVSMESKSFYAWKLIKVYLLSGIVYLLMRTLSGEDKSFCLFFAMAPFGITLVNSIIPFSFVGEFGIVFMLWVLKLALSAIVGIIACPITTIYYIVKIIKA